MYNDGQKTLEEVAQIGGKCLIPENIQDQAGWCFWAAWSCWKYPCRCRAVGVDDLAKVLSNSKYFMILWKILLWLESVLGGGCWFSPVIPMISWCRGYLDYSLSGDKQLLQSVSVFFFPCFLWPENTCEKMLLS